MTTALATRDDMTVDGEIIEATAPMTLFGTDDPNTVVERASAVATALASVINERHLYASIGGKKHVQVEGWTLLGSMTGVFAEVVWSRPVEDGWEARAVGRTLAGQVVGAAEAMCTRREGKWRSADDYAIRSMSQTRAVSKALRMPLGFIMHLAGYDATPAEEIPIEQPERASGGRQAAGAPRASAPAPAPAQRTPEEQRVLDEILALPGMSAARMSLLADRAGVPKGTRATLAQLNAILDYATQPLPEARPEQPAAVPAAGVGEVDGARASTSPDIHSPEPVDSPPVDVAPAAPTAEEVAEAVGGEVIPPRPRTDAYRALPDGAARAAARAYWDAHKEPEPQQESLAEQLGAPPHD